MNAIAGFIDWITKILTWWVVIMPWESGIRVRLGNRLKTLNGGTFLKLPIIDVVYVQTTRMRVINFPVQTVTTLDGKTISLIASGGYSIVDIRKLYDTLHHPELTLINIVMGAIAQHVATNSYTTCSPAEIETEVNKTLTSYGKYGLKDVSIKITGYAVVRTYRLISDHHHAFENISIESKR